MSANRKSEPLRIRKNGRFEITKGQGKWDLLVALGENSSDSPHVVEFWIKSGETTAASDPRKSAAVLDRVEVALESLAHEDGSGQRWLFKGYNPHSHQGVKGYYDLHNRKGWMEFHL